MQTSTFIHPEDAAALKTLQSIPALSSVVKAFMNMGIEQLQVQFARVSFLLPQLKQTASPVQIDQIRELLAEISVLVAARGIFEKQEY